MPLTRSPVSVKNIEINWQRYDVADSKKALKTRKKMQTQGGIYTVDQQEYALIETQSDQPVKTLYTSGLGPCVGLEMRNYDTGKVLLAHIDSDSELHMELLLDQLFKVVDPTEVTFNSTGYGDSTCTSFLKALSNYKKLTNSKGENISYTGFNTQRTEMLISTEDHQLSLQNDVIDFKYRTPNLPSYLSGSLLTVTNGNFLEGLSNYSELAEKTSEIINDEPLDIVQIKKHMDSRLKDQILKVVDSMQPTENISISDIQSSVKSNLPLQTMAINAMFDYVWVKKGVAIINGLKEASLPTNMTKLFVEKSVVMPKLRELTFLDMENDFSYSYANMIIDQTIQEHFTTLLTRLKSYDSIIEIMDNVLSEHAISTHSIKEQLDEYISLSTQVIESAISTISEPGSNSKEMFKTQIQRRVNIHALVKDSVIESLWAKLDVELSQSLSDFNITTDQVKLLLDNKLLEPIQSTLTEKSYQFANEYIDKRFIQITESNNNVTDNSSIVLSDPTISLADPAIGDSSTDPDIGIEESTDNIGAIPDTVGVFTTDENAMDSQADAESHSTPADSGAITDPSLGSIPNDSNAEIME